MRLFEMKEKQYLCYPRPYGGYTIHFKPTGERFAKDLFGLDVWDKDKIIGILKEAGYTEMPDE